MTYLMDHWTLLKNFLVFHHLHHWAAASLVFSLCLVVFLILWKILKGKFIKWSAQTPEFWDDFLVKRISLPAKVFIWLSALGIAIDFIPPELRGAHRIVLGLKLAFIVTMIWALERVIGVLFLTKDHRFSTNPTTNNFLLIISRIVIFSLGLLVILDTMGISITPLLASLGVGSLAVALALQDTLTNFFAGMHLMTDRPVRIGDYVKVDNIEGTVVRISWRSTRIQMGSNDTVALPNSKMASSLLINYSLPSRESTINLEMRVGLESDFSQIERLVKTVGQEVMNSVPGGVPGFEVLARFHSISDLGLNFTVCLRAKTYPDNGLVKHEFLKAILLSFRSAGIDIPVRK